MSNNDVMSSAKLGVLRTKAGLEQLVRCPNCLYWVLDVDMLWQDNGYEADGNKVWSEHCVYCRDRVSQTRDMSLSGCKTAIKVKLLHPQAKLPTRSYKAAAYDLYACFGLVLAPGVVTSVKTRIATELPPGYAALIWDRSGMGKKGITVFGGVIDEDYRGEWQVMLFNSNAFEIEIQPGDRIAQFVLQEVKQIPVVQVDELADTERGEKGFASTGR